MKQKRMMDTNCAHELRFNDVIANTIFSSTELCTIIFDVQKFFINCLNSLIDEHVEDIISLVCLQYEANKMGVSKHFEIHWISDDEQLSETVLITNLQHDYIMATSSNGRHKINLMDIIAVTSTTKDDLHFIHNTHQLFFTTIGYVELFSLRNNAVKQCYISTSNDYVHHVNIHAFSEHALIVGGSSQYISNNKGYGGANQSKFEIKYTDIVSVAVKGQNEVGKLHYETTKRDKWAIRFFSGENLRLV